MRITAVENTELFVGTEAEPQQVLRVLVSEVDGRARIEVTGPGVNGAADLPPEAQTADGAVTVEIGLSGLPATGTARVTVTLRDAEQVQLGDRFDSEVVVAEPGWTVWMVPHFHYDPVWWNTQAAYTSTWDDAGEEAQRVRMAFQQPGFALVSRHMRTARLDPDYKFVLAEVDYLKPYWDAHPGDRAYLRRLLAEGRLEVMGGTYNEPNTNLTGAETTARNFVYGAGFQRDVLGADPHTAWQLDVFGHDPQFPGMAAEAGLTSSSWARGPFHQWGPMLWTHAPMEDGWGDPSVMQFPAEFEWLSPSGRGVLTHYMPAHYSSGWQIDSQTTLAAAEDSAYRLFTLLKKVAATRNVLLPVGTDYTPPSKWVTEIHRDWPTHYVWPRMRCAVPSEFFGAVREQLAAEDRHPSPQTRDMNPIYTGKDVSFIDTKQAQRQAENLLIDAEKYATIAMIHGAGFPHVAMDKAWRQLVFGAHHDAITGSESDQVYIDLLTGWREAHDVGREVLSTALAHLHSQVEAVAGASGDLVVTVFNPSSWERTDLVTTAVSLETPGSFGLTIVDPTGSEVPALVECRTRHPDGSVASAQVTFVATAPGIGYRTGWRIRPVVDPGLIGWATADGDPAGEPAIESATHRLLVDPERGGAVSELFDKRSRRQVLRQGEVGNELQVYEEYPEHPRFHEGPWHLVPTGRHVGSSSQAAESVRVQRCPIGSRITVTGTIGALRYEQRLTLWDGLGRIECATSLDGFDGSDELVRLRWPVDVPGALPVSEVGNAVIGRGFALIDADSADHPWTLDNPANNWFAVSSTVRVRIRDATDDSARAAYVDRALGVAELVAPNGEVGLATRELAIALVGQGVTSTSSCGDGPRYGRLELDSNLPDVRIALGGPDDNDLVAARLASADPQYRIELDKQLAENGTARVWVPADVALADAWVPSADLTDPGCLPMLVLVGDGATASLVEDLDDAVIEVSQHAVATTMGERGLEDYTVGLLNQGVPGFAVDTSGALHLSLLRSCTGWPSGVWIDPPRRTALDGSNFQQEHWSHRFDYALCVGSGDWRSSGLVRHGHDFNHPLRAVVRGGNDPTGALPSEQTFLRIDPPAQVVLAALKPRGNPLATGRPVDAADGITVRMYEAVGARPRAQLRSSWESTRAERLDLLERPSQNDRASVGSSDDGVTTVDLRPMEIGTVGLAAPSSPALASAPDPGYGTQAEPHQPVYSRYWLNNTGPAPRGNLPVTVHVEPTLVEVPIGSVQDVVLNVAVASNYTTEAVSGSVGLILPDGWTADRPALAYDLVAGGHAIQATTIHPAVDSPRGTYWVRARIASGGQRVEDVCRVVLGSQDEPELDVALLGSGVSLAPGSVGEIVVQLRTTARTPVSAQVQLIGPWPTWSLVRDWDSGAEVRPGELSVLRFQVSVPPLALPGSWWMLVKVACAGILHYTEPVAVVVVTDRETDSP